MAAAPPKILPAVLTQGFIQHYYGEMANMDPEASYAQLSKLFGSKNPLLIVRQGEELRSKEEIIAKFQRIQSRGSIFVECLGFNGDYLSLSGHSSGEPSPFHLVTWGTMKIGTQPAVPFTESFVLSGSRSGSSYAYSINRSVLVFPTLTSDIDEYNMESPTAHTPNAAPADASPSAASNPSSDSAAAPPPSNRSRDREPNKARTPRKTQDSSDAASGAAASAVPADASDAAAKEKQDKQSAPTSYASAARMVPSAPRDETRYASTRPTAQSSSGAAAAARAPAAAAAAKEATEDLPNGIIVKRIPDGFRLTQEFAQALLPNKKVAHVHAIPEKSHGFIYLVNEEDVRQLSLPSPVTFSFQGATISVSIDRKKPKSSGPLHRSGDTPRGRSQPHPDGFTQVAPRSRGRSDGHADGDDGARRVQGGRATGGGRGGAKPHGH